MTLPPALRFAQLASAGFTRKFWAGSPLLTTLRYDPPAGLLEGRTVVVTGANAGLGLETAVHLARLGPARVIMACRSLERGEKAKGVVVERSGIEAGRVDVWEVDMASFASVKAFAARCDAELDRLDVACLNAGITGLSWRQTVDNWEENLQVNGIATGLLAVLLLPVLARSASIGPPAGSQPFKPHLTIVGSVAHETIDYVRPDATCTTLLADLNDPNSRNTRSRYQFTKLISLFLGRKIARLPAAEKVVVNVANPGLCRTDIFHEAPGWLTKAGFIVSWSAEDGAKNIAWACVTDTPPGAYVEGTAVGKVSRYAAGDDGLQLERDLWAEMSKVWAEAAPQLKEVLQ